MKPSLSIVTSTERRIPSAVFSVSLISGWVAQNLLETRGQ